MQSAGIEPEPGWIVPVEGFLLQAGLAGGEKMLSLRPPPTAVFAIADTLALGVTKAAKAAGMKLPEDLAVVGFNNIAYAEISDPPLTTVAAPAQEMGRRAMIILHSLIAGQRPGKKHIVLETTLVIRRSCGCQYPA